MRMSYSRATTFENCPYKFKLQYIDELTTIPSDAHDNALIVGQAMHKGIETDVQTGVDYYYNSYNVITDNHK